MRKLITGILLLFIIGCGSSSTILESGEKTQKVYLDASEVRIESNNRWFSEESLTAVDVNKTIEKSGQELLELVVTGYSDQVGNFEVVNSPDNADVVFKIEEIIVGQRTFTMNFVKPGPIYLMKIKAIVESEGFENYSLSKKSLVNMAEVSYPDEGFKWMNNDEKSDTQNQLNTFNSGLRKLYQNLFFEAFDISLQL